MIGFYIPLGLIVFMLIVGNLIFLSNKLRYKKLKQQLEIVNFNINKKLKIQIGDSGFVQKYIFIDNTHKKIAFQIKGNLQVYAFRDLINYEVFEDGSSRISGNLGGAIVGSVLMGTTGAILGSSLGQTQEKFIDSLELRIRVNDFKTPEFVYKLINGRTFTYTRMYKKTAEQLRAIIADLEYISNINKLDKEQDNANT